MVEVMTTMRGRKPLILPKGETTLEIIGMQGWVIAACTNGLYAKREGQDWGKVGLMPVTLEDTFQEEFERRGKAIAELEERLAALEKSKPGKSPAKPPQSPAP